MAQGSVVDEQGLEREYLAHRRDVLAMLHSEFRGLSDHEELYQEAWTEALELQARGGDIANLGGLLRTIAWRRARDQLRDWAPAPVDPTSVAFVSQSDAHSSPDEQLQARVDSALIREIVDSLDPREAALIKLRFDEDLEPFEIQQRLGMSRPLFEKLLTQAYKRVGQALADRGPEATEWQRRQRSLLVACETGIASERQRRRAARIVDADPACRVMLREIRATLEGVAAILPLPVLVADAAQSRLTRIRLGILDRLGILRDQAADLAARSASHGSPIEQAGAGGAATLGGGLAVKAALVCVAVTGTTVVCLTGGVVETNKEPDPPRAQTTPVIPEPKPPKVVVRTPVATVKPVVRKTRVVQKEKTVKVAAPPPPSPAPTGSSEFGPGTVGSSSAPTTPAAAPAGGGGEFGP